MTDQKRRGAVILLPESRAWPFDGRGVNERENLALTAALLLRKRGFDAGNLKGGLAEWNLEARHE